MTPREAFLERVRQAVRAGNRPGETAGLGPRGRISYQGAGPDPVGRFRDELTALGGQAHIVADRVSAAERVSALVQARRPCKVIVGQGELVDSLDLAAQLRGPGIEVVSVNELSPAGCRDPLFAADIGIGGVDYLVAETGSILLRARPGEPRSLSLLPPVHIAVASRRQLLPDLFDLFDALAGDPLSSALSLITGPSKTGDIELRLVTGVHGPGDIHVVLVDDGAGQ